MLALKNEKLNKWILFLIGGGLNTALTYGIYLLLNLIINYQVSYVVAYLSGILFSYLFNSQIVFKLKKTWKGLLIYPSVYLIQYLISAALLHILVESFGLPKEVAPLLIIVALLPVTYILSKTVLRASHEPQTNTDSQAPNEK
ncbi:GtrA family protein [Pseudomonas sp. Sample_22]|uniref:GtrA family protein n=1 Tax=Pseudomonas sp. Sample_22 TaxID=2448266 RepID=UPI001F4F5502|nr:GtrA family protein [Pseudomonas sp. Sample_22]